MPTFDELYLQFGRPAEERYHGEPVTYVARRTVDGSAADAEFPVTGAVRLREEQRPSPFATASTEARKLKWRIRKSFLSDRDLKPERGDVLKDAAGNDYTIESWTLDGLAEIYEFHTEAGRN